MQGSLPGSVCLQSVSAHLPVPVAYSREREKQVAVSGRHGCLPGCSGDTDPKRLGFAKCPSLWSGKQKARVSPEQRPQGIS